LIDEDRGPLSTNRLRQLEAGVESAKRKKRAYLDYAERVRATKDVPHDDTFEVSYLDCVIKKLQGREDRVERNLEQLKFEAARDHYRVVLVDPASAPKNPSNDARLRYMAAAPLVVFLLVFGACLLQEIRAGRVAPRMSDRDLD
jgi:hypothetical protein